MAEMLISLENGKENSNSKQSQSALQPKKENKSTSKQQAKKIVKKEEPGDKKGRGRQAKKKEDEILLSQILAEEQEEIEFQELQRQMKETVEENNSEQNGSEPGSPSNRPIYSSKQNKEEKDGAKNQDSQAIYYSNLLDSLLSPIRFEQIYESWTPKQIAIFECAICKFGKQFGFISQLLRTKDTQDVFEFYIIWKQTSHYKQWKTHRNISNRHNFTNLV